MKDIVLNKQNEKGMNRVIQYRFVYQDHCIMCGDNTKRHKFLGLRLNQSQGYHPQKKAGIRVSVYRCSKCGLIYANPLPIPVDLQDHYGVPPESYWQEEYFRTDPNYLGSVIKRLKEFDLTQDSKVLDIGAGLGKGMIAFNNAGFQAYGIEPSMPFYQRAVDVMGVDSNKIKCVSIEDAVFENDFFDFISFGAVLEHLPDPSLAILKAIQWLKPGGIIRIEVPSSNWLIPRIVNTIYKLKAMPYVTNISPMHEPYHLYEFSKDAFEFHAKCNKYHVIGVEYYICNSFMPKIFDPVLRPLMKHTNTGMEICVWIKK